MVNSVQTPSESSPPAEPSPQAQRVLLMNPHSGQFSPTANVDQMRRLVDELGVGAEVVATESAEHMASTLTALIERRAELIAISGGDGTLAGAIQLLAGSGITVGILPQGTNNNFAKALGLPIDDLPSALRVLVRGTVEEVDLGYACDRYFVEAAGVGLYADTLALYGQNKRKSLWRGLYAVGKTVTDLRARRLKLTLDGETVIERAVLCEVANTRRIGTSLPMAPDARVTDGLLDVVVAGDLTVREIVSYYRAAREQRHLTLPKMKAFQASRITIESRHPMRVRVDGEVIGRTPVTIEVKPKALRVMVDCR